MNKLPPMLIIAAFALSACQTTRPLSPAHRSAPLPAALFDCPAAPSALGIQTDNQLADFIAGLSAAHRECRTKLQNLKPLVGGNTP
jgi:hypothetical protein